MKPFGTVVLAKVSDAATVPLAANVCWLTEESDWSFVADWRKAVRKDRSPSLRDALEYAQLGCKRWRFLFRQRLKSRIHRTLAPAVRSRAPAPDDISDRFVFNSAEIASYNKSGPVKFAD